MLFQMAHFCSSNSSIREELLQGQLETSPSYVRGEFQAITGLCVKCRPVPCFRISGPSTFSSGLKKKKKNTTHHTLNTPRKSLVRLKRNMWRRVTRELLLMEGHICSPFSVPCSRLLLSVSSSPDLPRERQEFVGMQTALMWQQGRL